MYPRKKSPDVLLFGAIVFLLSIGVIMVYSASQVSAFVKLDDTFFYLKKQIMWALIGLTTMILVMKVDYWKYKKWAVPFLVTAFILLVAVLVPGIGKNVNGARRWIGIGPGFQPSEVIKLSMVIFMAYGLSIFRDRIKYFSKGILPFLVILGMACVLILMQPDLGTAVSMAGTVYIMLFAAGAKGKHLGYLGVAGVGAVCIAIILAPYRMSRFLAFLDPWKDPSGTGYHIIQALYALGSGGLFGMGLG